MTHNNEFANVLSEMLDLHDKKNADYGTAADPFANVRASEDFGIPAWLGSVIRANDKMTRLKAFAQKGSLENEPVEDSLIDLANYCVIALILWRDMKQPNAITDDCLTRVGMDTGGSAVDVMDTAGVSG